MAKSKKPSALRRQRERLRKLPIPRCHYKAKERKKPKIRYPSKVDAMIALAWARTWHETNGKPVEERAYPCQICGGWHLTGEERQKRS